MDYPHILIADDSQEDTLLTVGALSKARILNPIVTVIGGKECLAHVEQARRDLALPCLILLDLVMFPIDGVAVLRELKARALLEAIPVVMLSGIRNMKVVSEGYQLGARTFLIKPISPERFLGLLSTLKEVTIEQKPEGFVLLPGKAPVKGASESKQS
jgi:CheY-like chemotaxis protein